MKIKIFAAATCFLASSAMAQSAFQGFYGQIGTGYESNSVSSGSGNLSASTDPNAYNVSSPSQQFGGAPLVLGLGYNFSVAPKWLIGIGVDYSALSQTSSTFSTSVSGASFNGASGTFNGLSVQASNRYNIFITPGYVIDKDKLVYLKAGYSSVGVKLNGPNSFSLSSGAFSQSVPVGTTSSSTSTLSGYILGLGYKQIISGGFYGFAEGNYMSYGRTTFSNTSSIQSAQISSSINPSLNSYQLLVGVGYKF